MENDDPQPLNVHPLAQLAQLSNPTLDVGSLTSKAPINADVKHN
jgi:hypothetical protein